MLKRIIQKFLLLVLLATTISSSIIAAVDYRVENQPYVIEEVIQIEQKGILKQKDNGYLYLDVSNEYISKSLPLIDALGKIVPPSHYKSKKGIGAHISVMYENERIENEIWDIDELGKEYSFSIMEIRTVKLNKNNQMKKLWLIAVSSPELEQLREKYGLKPLLKGHDFHISIGTQVPAKSDRVMMPVQHEVEMLEIAQAA